MIQKRFEKNYSLRTDNKGPKVEVKDVAEDNGHVEWKCKQKEAKQKNLEMT